MITGVRVAAIGPADRAEIAPFLRSTPWNYEHFELPRGGVLGQAGYVARNGRGQLVGVLGCRLDRPPIASIQYVSLGTNSSAPAQTVAALLAPAEAELRAAGARALTYIGAASWLRTCLEKAGFVQYTKIVTYQRWGGAAPSPAESDIVLRPATAEDAVLAAALDEAAFEPMWRYMAETHRDLIGRLPHYQIAEIGGAPVGYAAGDIVWARGHIIRVVAHPDHQRRGVGTHLLCAALRFFEQHDIVLVMLNTQQDNIPSRRLYERWGFSPTGEDVPVLVKEL